MCYTRKTSEMMTFISSTVSQCFVMYLDSRAVYRLNSQLLIHLPALGLSDVCFTHMQVIFHQYIIYAVVMSSQSKPQSNFSAPNWLAHEPSPKVINPPHMSVGMLHFPFELFLVSTTVRNCCTSHQPALLLRGSASDYHQKDLNWCCWHRYHDYRCLCWCSPLHRYNVWIIQWNVPHLMTSVTLLSIPLIGVAIRMLVIFQTASIRLDAIIKCLLRLPSLALFVALDWQLGVRCCRLWIVYLLKLQCMGIHLRRNLLWHVGQCVNHVIHHLDEHPPMIILQYTNHQVLDVLTVRHRISTSIWAIGISAIIEVIHITFNLR